MQHVRCGFPGLALLVASSSALAQTGAKVNAYGNPQTLKPAATSSAIDVKDLQTRLYQFADDSMMGRQIGRVGNYKGTAYLANEVKRLGLLPGGGVTTPVVPIAFFFTGLHGDYHQRSDEAEFIDYPHYAKIANYIRDIVVEIGNGPRPQLNGTKPAKPRVITP